MPEVSQKEVGRRLYHVHREKRAEVALKQIKSGLGEEWRTLTPDEIHFLGLLLQCTWNVVNQKEWGKIPFSHVTIGEVKKILAIGKGYVPGVTTNQPVIEEIKKILLSVK